MKQIKAGRNTFDIKQGDYVLYNGCVWMFCSGDNRPLVRKGIDAYNYVILPAKQVKALPLSEMIRNDVKTSYSTHTRYYFTEKHTNQ